MYLRLLLLFTCLVVGPLFGRSRTDVIVMKNGDRFTCEIKTLDRGVLSARLEYVDGIISIQWSKVARIESSQLFLVQTQDGSVYEGTIRTAATAGEEPVKIQITETSQQLEVVAREQIVGMNQGSESFWRRFSGNFNTGLIYSRGNNTTQYSLGSDLTYRRERWSAEANVSSALSTSNRETASTRNQINMDGLRLLPWNNWFYTGIGSFLQSSQQEISRQTSLGGGIGRYLKNTNRARIYLVGGFAWQNTQYQSQVNLNQQAAAGLISGNVQLFVFRKTNLTLDGILFPALNQPGRVRFYTNSVYSIQIFKQFWWNFSFYGNWDNKPPDKLPGSDYGTSSGISYSFN